jgi:hypothetical protein
MTVVSLRRPHVPEFEVLNCVHLFSTTDHTWRRVDCLADGGGAFPPARRSHTATLVGDTVFLLGGSNTLAPHEVFPSHDVWALDTRTWRWQLLSTKWPVPSFFHTAVATPSGHVLTFGGVRSGGAYEGVPAGDGEAERHNRVCCFHAHRGVLSLRELATQAVATHLGARADALARLKLPRHLLARVLPR